MQDDEDFEIASFSSSLDNDVEGARLHPAPDGHSNHNLRVNSISIPAKSKPVKDRQSLDGKTIFAVVNDGDKWSNNDLLPRISQGKDETDEEKVVGLSFATGIPSSCPWKREDLSVGIELTLDFSHYFLEERVGRSYWQGNTEDTS